MSDKRDELESTLSDVDWSCIRPHAVRGGAILLEAGLDILEIGRAFADDKSALVKELIESGKLKKLEKADVEFWDKEPTKPVKSLIVDPFVLFQLIQMN